MDETISTAIADAVAKLAGVDSCPDDVYMDVDRFCLLRGEGIPIDGRAGPGTGVHIRNGSPPTWHYISECTAGCP